MQSLRDKNRTKHTRTKIGISIAVLVLLFVLAPIVFPKLGGGFRTIFASIWKLENNTSSNLSSFFANFKSKRALEAENNALKNKIIEGQATLADHDALLHENEALKELLGRHQAGSFILGTILVKPGRSLYDIIVIDVGSTAGISNGAVVYAFGNIPIGNVTSVSSTTATVTLFSTAGQVTDGRVEGKNIDVELLGRGGGNFEIKVPRDVMLDPGMSVLLPGLSPSVIAVIAKSITDARDPAQTFLLTSPVNINELNWVEVAK